MSTVLKVILWFLFCFAMGIVFGIRRKRERILMNGQVPMWRWNKK